MDTDYIFQIIITYGGRLLLALNPLKSETTLKQPDTPVQLKKSRSFTPCLVPPIIKGLLCPMEFYLIPIEEKFL